MKRLVDLALDEFLQALVLLHFELHIVFLRDQQLMAAELLFVQLQLFLESWHFVNHVPLRIFQFLDDLSASAFLLAQSEFEVLSLGFKHLSKLCFLSPQLLSLLFQGHHPFVVF